MIPILLAAAALAQTTLAAKEIPAAAHAATQIPGGLCVVLPATDGAALAAFSDSGRFVVRGFTPASSLDAVRDAIPANLGGLVSAEAWRPGPTLPFADHLIDLLVVDRDALQNGPGDAELLRVIAPACGAVWQKKGGQWSKLTKPLPREYGTWTHYYGDATSNPVSKDTAVKVPTGLQWISYPADIAQPAGRGGTLPGGFPRLHLDAPGVQRHPAVADPLD